MRLTTGFVLWLVAAVAATAVGLVAVSAIGTDIFGGGQDPLSQSEVDDLLASSPAATSATPTTSTAPTSSTTPPPPPPAEKTIVTDGGTVIARCEGGLVRVRSTIPAQGYRVDDHDDEVDDHPTVKFRSAGREVEVRLRCLGGIPSPDIRYDD